MTSSDVLDTCLNVQLARAADLLIADTDALLAALKKRALEYKMTPTIGRSHGIHAEPTTFGVKLATYYAEFTRARARLVTARAEIATCAISGAVGSFANIDPQVEEYVAKQMGLQVEPVSTQVIPRDRHAAFFATLGVVASSLERLAVEIRHLQRTEVLEAEEYFSPGQKGSSAMPHKRNPVLTENVTGLARMVRSYAIPAMENVALWHERDISHSSVERYIGPDATITLDFALARMTGVVEKLVVYPERMQKNLDATHGLVHSQRVLLALTQAGLAREDSYRSGAEECDARLERRRQSAGSAEGRSRCRPRRCPPTSSKPCSTWAITSRPSTRSSTGFSNEPRRHRSPDPRLLQRLQRGRHGRLSGAAGRRCGARHQPGRQRERQESLRRLSGTHEPVLRRADRRAGGDDSTRRARAPRRNSSCWANISRPTKACRPPKGQTLSPARRRLLRSEAAARSRAFPTSTICRTG
jgi:adenylosuccinate lyase